VSDRIALHDQIQALIRSKSGSITGAILLFAIVGFLSGCGRPAESTVALSGGASAKELFERVTKEFHIPSAEAKGAEKLRLQTQATAGYHELLKRFPNDEYWAAQAVRSLGNIYAAQTNIDAAVREYRQVGTGYPKQEWEVVMAWKSAADLLWEAGHQTQARQFYQEIISRFDNPEAAQVVKMVVRGSKERLSGGELAG
jgi:tetratricopeptide (TPR) repeat protein